MAIGIELQLSQTTSHVEKGSLIAKGQESVDSSVVQFSSLMNVMHDDFSMMSSMQRAYVAEKSSVQPIVHEIQPVEPVKPQYTSALVAPKTQSTQKQENTLDSDIGDDVESIDLTGLFVQQETEGIDSDRFDAVLFDTIPNIPEMTDMFDDVVVPVLLNVPTIVTDIPTLQNWSQDIAVDVYHAPSVAECQQVIVQEVSDVVNLLVQENIIPDTLDNVDEISMFDIIDPYVDTINWAESNVDTVDAEEPETYTSEEPVVAVEDTVDFFAEESTITEHPTQTNTATTIAVGQNPATFTANNGNLAKNTGNATNSNLQQLKSDMVKSDVAQNLSNENHKKNAIFAKMVKHQNFQHFLHEAQEEGTFTKTINSKILKKLEVVITDPSGSVDVEISQDNIGIQVVATASGHVVKQLQGLEQDLYTTLQDSGVELSFFEMRERENNAEQMWQSDGTQDIQEDVEQGVSEVAQKTGRGGTLLDRMI